MSEEKSTRVVFRKWNKRNGGDVIALFPDEIWHNGLVDSYMHDGQHGGASYMAVIASSTLATPDEYASLRRELESSPFNYNLRIVKRA